MKHLKVRAKLLVGFAFISALTLIVGLIGTFGLMSTSVRYHDTLSASAAGISSMADMRELYQMQRLMLRAMMVDIDNPERVQSDIDALRQYEDDMAEAMAAYESTITDHDSEQSYYSTKDAYFSDYQYTKEKFVSAVQRGDKASAEAILEDGKKAAEVIASGMQGTVDYINRAITDSELNLSKAATRTVIIQVAVMAASIIIAITLSLYISSLISNPLKTMGDFFMRFGTMGDLSLSEDDQRNISAKAGDRDEIGQCISSAAKLVGRITDINEKLGKVSGGDLSVDISPLSEKDSLGLAIAKMLGNLNAMFCEFRSASGQVSIGSEQIAQGAQELAAGSSQQAASIEEFSSSLSDLRQKTERNAENSTKAAEVNENIRIMIEQSTSSMDQMLNAMKHIDESSRDITRIIKVIDDIAFQTNILALNAAVEAARAGTHGKGFAVVSDEVRNLASKSAAAAKETASLIEGSSEKVKEGNLIVDKTNASLQAVAAGSKEMVHLIGEVSSSSSEQATAIREMSHSIEQISSVIQENSASAQESAAASEEMSSQALLLTESISRFKLKDSDDALNAHDPNAPAYQSDRATAANRHVKY